MSHRAGLLRQQVCRSGTRIADAAGGVTDEAWANAAKHYDEDQLAALVSLIAEQAPGKVRPPGPGQLIRAHPQVRQKQPAKIPR